MAASAAASVKSSSSPSVTRRSSGSKRRSGGRQLAKAIIFGLGGVALAALVVRTSVSYALVDLNPYVVSRVAPDDPRVALNIALVEFASQNGALSDRTRDRAYAALAKAPLADIPMLIAGVSALAAGDTGKGERMLAEARHRDPRFLLARLLLLDRYLKTGRVAEAGEEIAVLARLAPETGSLLVPELARMAADPRTGTILMGVLDMDPRLQQEVLSKLAGSAPPDLVLRLAGKAPPPAGTTPEWQGVLLGRLVGSQDYGRAYALWRDFARLPADSGGKSVYDGAFRNLPGAAPFNWQLTGSAAGVAERNHDGGLQVQYFGRAGAELATQLLLLRPGSYRLRVQAEGDASGDGARLSWTLDCAQSKAKLAELPLVKIKSALRTIEARFTVPAGGCSAQWLRLSGRPAEFPTEQDATIHDVRVERIGA
jgi:hypothetical protein